MTGETPPRILHSWAIPIKDIIIMEATCTSTLSLGSYTPLMEYSY